MTDRQDTQASRQADRRTNIQRQTGGQTDRQTDRTDRHTGRQTDVQSEQQTDKQTDRPTKRQTDRQTKRQTDRQTNRQSDTQKDRQVGRQSQTDRKDKQHTMIMLSSQQTEMCTIASLTSTGVWFHSAATVSRSTRQPSNAVLRCGVAYLVRQLRCTSVAICCTIVRSRHTVLHCVAMAPKGVQSKQWRDAVEKVQHCIQADLLHPSVTNDTADDEKYMDAGVYFGKKFPSQESKNKFYADLQGWLASIGADVEYAMQAVHFVSLHFTKRGATCL